MRELGTHLGLSRRRAVYRAITRPLLAVGALFGIVRCDSYSGDPSEFREGSGGADAGADAAHDSGATGGTMVPTKDGGAGETGTEDPDGAVFSGVLSECVSRDDLPRSCDEVCLDQGQACTTGCDFGWGFPSRAGYYADLAACERGELSFSEAAHCDDPFADVSSILHFGAVRCCCEATEYEIATKEEREKLCQVACEDEPTDTLPPECSLLPGCGDLCLQTTQGLDLECAACLVADPLFGESHCNTWECQCGSVLFDPLWGETCALPCAAARQRVVDEYATAPRPEPYGPTPAKLLEVPSMRWISDIEVDAQGRVWVAGTSLVGQVQTVALFDSELKPIWEWSDPQGRGTSNATMIRSGGKIQVATRSQYEDQLLFTFDSTGLIREDTLQGSEDLSALSALGDALLLRRWIGVPELLVTDLLGSPLWTVPDTLTSGLPGSWVHSVGADGSWTLVAPGPDGLYWRELSPAPPSRPSAGSIEWNWFLPFPPTATGGGSPASLQGAGAGAGGSTLAWGSLWENRYQLSGGFPYVARLSPQGAAAWQWKNGDEVTPGAVNDALLTTNGETCLIGSEDWEHSARVKGLPGPKCSPDGCKALTVRCLGDSGEEQWVYQHRNVTSYGNAIAATPEGRLFVAGAVSRDFKLSTGTNAIILAFDALSAD